MTVFDTFYFCQKKGKLKEVPFHLSSYDLHGSLSGIRSGVMSSCKPGFQKQGNAINNLMQLTHSIPMRLTMATQTQVVLQLG